MIKKRIYGAFTGAILATLAMWMVPIQAKITAGDITGGVKAPHVNIAIFHKLHGHDGFQYPEHIKKTEILQAMQDDAQFIAISHTAGLKDGDVITMSNDVLREGDSSFEDFGVDCQLSLHVKGADVSLAGMCQILMMDQDGRIIDHKGIVKQVTLKQGADWQLIYYDAEDGIAVYANEEIGLE